MVYRDLVRLSVRSVEVAYRAGRLEVNVDEGCWEGVRVYEKGSWRIRSAPCGRLGGKQGPARGEGLAEAVLYTGVYESGPRLPGPDELEKLVERVGGAVEEAGCTGEAIVVGLEGERRITHYEGDAIHRFRVIDVTLAAVHRGTVVSDRLGVTDARELTVLPRLAASMCEKARLAARRLEALSPMESGRWSVILAGSAAGALIHELAHLLAGDRGPRLQLGARIAPEEFNLRDEPGLRTAPYSHVFDDEGVVAAARRLVSLGEVSGYLGVRWRGVGRPGSARGLFTPPAAMHTVLVLSPGDWREGEIVEETRRGVIVETVAAAWVDETGVVTIIPELAWLVRNGEVVASLRFSRLRLRVARELQTIDALGRRLWPRLGEEKKMLQTELAPTIRLNAYID